MRLTLVLLAALAAAWFTYARLEGLGRRAWPAVLTRTLAWAALGTLLLDLTCATRGLVRQPLVLLDGSLSMSAAGGQWSAARDSALSWGEVRLFGDAGPSHDSLPTRGRSSLAPALAAAAASDRPVLVVTDGEVDDVPEIAPEALARASVRLFPRDSGSALAIGGIQGPERVTVGDTVRLEVEVRAAGPVPDSIRLEVRLDQRVLARRGLRLGAGGSGGGTLTFPTNGLSGDQVLSVAIASPADREMRDNARAWRLTVAQVPGIALLASPPDWDARSLYRTLREVADLPVRGYVRLEPGRWRLMSTLLPVTTEDVAAAARGADLLIVKGSAPEMTKSSRARALWLWPSGESGETVLPGEWYAVPGPSSPVAGAFVGQPVESFPPLPQITPIEPSPGDWVGLTAQLGRRGADRAVMLGQQSGGRRTVTMAADGFWRWGFRGGASEQVYRSLVAGTVSWLLGAGDSAQGKARLVRTVVSNGRPLVFEWSAAAAPAPLAVQLQGEGGARRDTLRFDGAGRAELWLPVGRYRYQLEGGGAGLAVVDTWSEEWFPRRVTLSARTSPEVAAQRFSSARNWLWLFGLALLGFCVEWVVRRSLGLR